MNKRYGSLDVLRIMAFVWVLLFHAGIHYGFKTGVSVFDHIISLGALGTTFFFTLSGFSLRKRYCEENMIEKQQMKKYLKRRLISIYPIYIVVTIIAYLLKYRIYTLKEAFIILPVQLTLTQEWFGSIFHKYCFNDNMWFLSSLLFLYVIFPFLNELINKIKIKNKIYACVVLIIVSWYIYYINIEFGNDFAFYHFFPLYRVPEFLLGMLCADIKIEKLIPGGRFIATMVLILCLSVMYPIFLGKFTMYNIFVLPFICVWCIYAEKESVFEHIGLNFIIRSISSMGLSIYVCQSLAIMTLDEQLLKIDEEGLWIWFILLTLLYALILHLFVEKPVKKELYR